jgi:hypothetical protein
MHPRPLLLREARDGTDPDATEYQVSLPMVRFRLNTSGVLLQARSQRRVADGTKLAVRAPGRSRSGQGDAVISPGPETRPMPGTCESQDQLRAARAPPASTNAKNGANAISGTPSPSRRGHIARPPCVAWKKEANPSRGGLPALFVYSGTSIL